MNTGADAADQIVRMTLNGVEVAAKITGTGAKELAVLLYAILKDQKKTAGKTRLTNMLKSGKELRVFAVKDADLEKFCKEAKKYGVLYCVLKDRDSKDGLTDIMVRAEDASKINRIFERFQLATVDIGQIQQELERVRGEQEAAMFRFKTIKLKKEHFIPKLNICSRVATLGTSSFILQAALVLVMATMNNVLKKYGELSAYGPDIPLAALGITMKVSQLVTQVAVGIASGIQPIYGYNYGCGKYDRVKKTYKLAMVTSTIFLTVALVVFQLFPEPIINLFGQESELYMQYAVKCFRIYLLGTFMVGVNAVTGVFFQSIGKSVQSALLSLSRQVVLLVPGLIILGALTGVEGLLWAGPISDIVAGILSLIMAKVYWNKIFPTES